MKKIFGRSSLTDSGCQKSSAVNEQYTGKMVESLRQILQQQVIRGRSMPNITVLWLIMQIG